MTNPARLPVVMIALALLGSAVAFYDSYAIYNNQPLWCPPPIHGCNEVAASPYARILDLPVGYYGVVYYLYMAALAAVAYAALGVAFSAYFLALQVGFIRAFCIYCLVSAITTILLLVNAVRHARTSVCCSGEACGCGPEEASFRI
jgi:uncharacterized membrane protein